MFRTNCLSIDESECSATSAGGLRHSGYDAASSAGELGQGVCLAESSSSRALKGTFLDPTIKLRGLASDALVAAVMDEFATHRQFRRKRQAREVEHEQQLLCCILANGLRCHWHRIAPIVSFQRKVDAAFYAGVSKPNWLSAQAMGRAVVLLAQCGLVEHQIGQRGTSSGYFMTNKFLARAEASGVSERSLGRAIRSEDLVQLKAPKPKSLFDRFTRRLVRPQAARIHFEATPETDRWTDGLSAYNEFLAVQDVVANPPDHIFQRWIENLNDDELFTGSQLCRPELFRDAVYRVFNDGAPDQPTFEKGGRLVGGWWINAPELVRRHITINRESTVELDYNACHPRMLYHELGLEPPADLYDIEEVAELERRDGCAAGAYRPFLKWLTQILINGRGRPDLVSLPTEMARPQDVSLRDITNIIERTHEPISGAFRSGAGLRLMKIESDIAYAIVTKACRNSWLALPVHDSFIAQRSRKKELKEMMIKEYKDRLGNEPAINEK